MSEKSRRPFTQGHVAENMGECQGEGGADDEDAGPIEWEGDAANRLE